MTDDLSVEAWREEGWSRVSHCPTCGSPHPDARGYVAEEGPVRGGHACNDAYHDAQNVEGGEPGGHGSIPDDPQQVGVSGTGAMTPSPPSTTIDEALETLDVAVSQLLSTLNWLETQPGTNLQSDIIMLRDVVPPRLALIRQEYETLFDNFLEAQDEFQQMKKSRDVSIKDYAELNVKVIELRLSEADALRELSAKDKALREALTIFDESGADDLDVAAVRMQERLRQALTPQEDKG